MTPRKKIDIPKMQSSIEQDWATPATLVAKIEAKLNIEFDLDVCAYDHTAKAPKWFTEADDALTKDWDESTCFMNPPYGNSIPVWLKYAVEQQQKHNNIIVCLVPARTDTQWFAYIQKHADIYLMKGRVAFERAHGKDVEHKPGAFGSMLAVIHPKSTNNISLWEWKN